MGKSIAIIGTLDTKGDEIRYMKGLIEDRGHEVVIRRWDYSTPMFE
jgi:uncharacterized protein (UPF0261 family)